MAHSVTHTFVSPVADDSDPNEVGPDEWNAAHTVTLDADELLTSIKAVDGTGSGLDADTVDGNEAAALLARANHTGTQAASTISDFDTEVSNNTDVAANTAARHVAVTVTDSSEINFTLTGQDITAALVAGSIDETKLDTSVNASLDLADSALQSSDIGTSVQAWDAQLDSLSSASANGVSLVTAANYAAMRGLLDLEAGTDFYSISAADAAFQPLDSDLTAIAGLSRTRGDLIRGGASAWERVALGTSGYALKSDGTDAVWAASREVLTANRTYYVRTDGSDSNDGLTNSSGGAFLTIQKAVDVAYALDPSIYDVTIQVGAGTYTTGALFSGPWIGSGQFTLLGDATTPSNCLISTTAAHAVRAIRRATVSVNGFKLQTTTSGHCLMSESSSLIEFRNIDFGTCAQWHIIAAGGQAKALANYSITGNAQYHIYAEAQAQVFTAGRTVTLTGTPAFTTFAFTFGMSYVDVRNVTYSGSATGSRYNVSQGSIINTNGGGATYLPGSTSGTATSPGVYI